MKLQKYLIFIQYYFHSVNFPPNKYRNIIIFGVSLRFCCPAAWLSSARAPSPASPPFARCPLPRSFCVRPRLLRSPFCAPSPSPLLLRSVLCNWIYPIAHPLSNCPLPTVRRKKKGRSSPPLLYIMCSPNYFAGSFSPCCSISRLAQMNGPTPFPSLSRMGSLI